MLLSHGTRENRSRPAIDPLFRSAGVAHGSRVIGVLFSGMLDDGRAGLVAIKRCGGVTVVQNPYDAAYPDMPTSALQSELIDHCVPAERMPELLKDLTSRTPPPSPSAPTDLALEVEITTRAVISVEWEESLGERVAHSCPD